MRVSVDVEDEWSQSVVSDSFVHVQAESEDEPSQSVVGAEVVESVAVAVFHSVSFSRCSLINWSDCCTR